MQVSSLDVVHTHKYGLSVVVLSVHYTDGTTTKHTHMSKIGVQIQVARKWPQLLKSVIEMTRTMP
jgi:hypothetical protein